MRHSLVVLSIILASVMAMAVAARAADQTVGTWKLNVAKSTFAPSTEAAVKELTLVKRELDGDQYELTETGTRTDGSTISVKFTHPQKGGVVKGQGATPAGEMRIVTVIGPGELYETVLQNDKQVAVLHAIVSKDGKTMSITTKGVDAKGKPYKSLDVFDKQ